MKGIFQRKIVAASISGTIYNVLLALIWPDPWNKQFASLPDYLHSVCMAVTVYMLYSIPAIFIYGILASIISDKMGTFASAYMKADRAEFIVSAMMHIVFGLILLWFSLGAAILFFITDRMLMLRRDRDYDGMSALKSAAIPVAVWLFFLAVVWGANDFSRTFS